MKRSEMVDLLLKYDDELLPMQAACIIDFLVIQGMQPPAYEKFVEIDYKLGLIGEKLYCKRPIHEWESE
jgi:hypothetical protein